MRPALRRWLVALAALLPGALPWVLDHLATPPADTRLRVASVGATVDDDAAHRVVLPHRWGRDAAAGCAGCRTVWYRLELARSDPPRDTQALLLPRAAHNAAVYLNGRLLAQGGRFADPATRLGARPLWAEAPPALWAAEDNRLFVLLKADRPWAGLMPAPALASAEVLRPVLAWRQALAVTLPQVVATAAAMLAVTMGLLWRHRPQMTGPGSLTLASAASAAALFAALLAEPPWADAAWDAARAGLAALAAMALARVAWRLLQPQAAGHTAAWSLVLLVVTVAAAGATAQDARGRVAEAVDLLALGALAAAGAGWFVAGLRRSAASLAVAGALLAACALHDAAGMLRAPLAAADAIPALPLGLAALLGAAAWTLLLRFMQTLNAAELLNVDLEGLVAARTAELQAQFERVRELERQQSVAAERERLMRDMHDGVGGHLVAMLAMIEADRRRPGELVVVVRDALDDMRLMIDSLEPVDDDLNAVLGMFHDRLAPRMRGAGVALHWDVELLPPVAGLTPSRVLHVLRMLQEGVTNALRHGQAKSLWVAARADGRQVRITLRDDGRGFDPAGTATGRGLKNLQRRAAEVGAELAIDSRPGQGTTLTLRWPLDAVSRSA